MATVLNRATKELRLSADENFHPTAQWIHNPDLSAVTGFAAKYWTISGDAVSLMSQGARDAVDAAELAAARDGTAARMEIQQSYERAFAEVLLDELNLHAQRVTAILNAADGAASYGAFRTAIGAIADVPTRTLTQLRTALRGKLG